MRMQAKTSDRAQEKRRRILDAARLVMLRDGLRGATMEAIARQAGIAKPTLYAQFADKDAVFVGLIETLLDQLIQAFVEGLDTTGNEAERIGEGLAQQYLVLAKLLDGSPHAAELMSEHKRLGMTFADKDAEMLRRIEAILVDAKVADAAELTHLVVSSAYGVALKTRDEAVMAERIRLLCRRLIEPELAEH